MVNCFMVLMDLWLKFSTLADLCECEGIRREIIVPIYKILDFVRCADMRN